MLNSSWNIGNSRTNEAHESIVTVVTSVKGYLEHEFLESPYITKFDKLRVKEIISQFKLIVELLNLMKRLINKFQCSASNDNFNFFIDIVIKKCMINIKNYLKEPFCIFPDLRLYMLCNQQAVGSCIIKARDIIWSSDDQQIGCICAKMVYMDMKVSLNENLLLN